MKRLLCAAMAALFLSVATSGCSLAYRSKYRWEGHDITEYGLIGLPAPLQAGEDTQMIPGLLPLWRQVED